MNFAITGMIIEQMEQFFLINESMLGTLTKKMS